MCTWVSSLAPAVASLKEFTDQSRYAALSAFRRGRSSRRAGSSTWMMPMPAASRSAISWRSARATWLAVTPSGWSSRTKDHARIVTGPVSIPLTGLSDSDCAYCGPAHRHRLRASDVAPQDRRARAARAVGLHPAVDGHVEAVEQLREVLHHVVALGLAVDQNVQAQVLLQLHDGGDLGLHRGLVVGVAQLALGPRGASLADLGGLREGADRRGRELGQVEAVVLRGGAHRSSRAGEVAWR